MSEHYIIQFPKNVRITDVPGPTNFREGPIQYKATYRQLSRQVMVDRELVVERPSQVCSASDRGHWREFNAILQRDLRSQVFYR